MELVFQERPMEYLEQMLNETVSQEETAEIIVPDSFPDVDRVIDSFGTLLIREKECSAGSVTLSGGVKAGVLFVPEGEDSPRLLEAYLPFTIRKEHETLSQDARVQCLCRIKEIDARMLNSRKVLLRLSLSCRVIAYGKREERLYDMDNPPEAVCLKRTVVPMTVAMDTGEKTFTINDELELPEGSPAVDRVYKALYRPEISEKRMIGNKAVFKGSLRIHTMYLGMDGSCNVFEGELPFSQYVEMGRDLDDHELRVALSFSGAELEPDGQMECHRLLVSLNLLAQCTAVGTQQVSYVEDGYDLHQVLEPKWASVKMTGRLDAQEFRENLSGRLQIPAKSVLDAWAYEDDVMQQRNGEMVSMQYGVACNVVYYDEEGNLQGKSVHLTRTADMELSSAAFCRPATQIAGEITTTAGNEVEVRCPVVMRADSFAVQEFRGVCGGELQPAPEDPDRPSVILRLVGQEESLWTVAKSYRTTVRNIMDANGLKSDSLTGEQMLLIPL